MNFRSRSSSKLTSIMSNHNTSIKTNQRVSRERSKQTLNRSKSNKSHNSTSSIYMSKSKVKDGREQKQNKFQIQKQYTSSSYKRFQQKLNIYTKIQDLIDQIKNRQSKLKTYFEIYTILQSEVGHQRCLQHNNDLSLYCQTQGKVLCVHCIYNETKHKTHKVIPLKDSIKHISNDINNLEVNIKCDIDAIKVKLKVSEKNQKFIQKHYRQQLQDLEKSYVEKLRQIQTDFQQKKQYVKDYFESLIQKNSQLTTTLKQFQQNLSLKMSILNKKDEISARLDLKQISKQSILTKIAEVSNLKGMSLEDMDEKDIGQNCLRSRIKTAKK